MASPFSPRYTYPHMKYLFPLLGLMLLLGAGCARTTNTARPQATTQTTAPQTSTTTEITTDTFTPPTGKATNPPPQSAGERRILIATSNDGITFTPTGIALTEQGNVPDMVIDANGMISIYYVGQDIENGKETTAVARSTDNGGTWNYYYLDFVNYPSPRDPSDPDVVILPDGTYRMYYTDNLSKQNDDLGIQYADSADGITFTYKGIALNPDFPVIDSTTFYFGGKWHMYVLDFKKPSQYYASSTDGKTFTTTQDSVAFQANVTNFIGSNPLITSTDVRLFGFGDASQDIGSVRSTDGITWTAESGSRLVKNSSSTLGGSYLQDLSVGKMANGTYLMVYVTDYP